MPQATFNDSIGVNTHLQFTIYDQNYNSWAPMLLSSGIKHVRDAFCNWGTSSGYCTGTWKSRFLAFYNAGIRFDIIADPWMGWTTSTTGCHGTCLNGYVAAMGLPSNSVESYEGPNECDVGWVDCTWLGTTSGQTTQNVVAKWSPLIWNLRSSTVKIYSPAMAGSNSYYNYGYIGNYTNGCAVHDEVNAYQTPEFTMLQYYPNYIKGCQSFVGNEPLIGTESDGWNTDISGGAGKCKNGAADQLAQERYFPRDLLLHIQRGVRVYPFELLDEGANGQCYQYGLIDSHFKPKLVWNRIGQLTTYFADSGTSPRKAVAYSLTGDTTKSLYQVLFQKSNGTYILVPWLGTQIWNYSTLSDLAPATETLTLHVPSTVTSIAVTTFGDRGAESTTTHSVSSGTVTLQVSSLIEAVAFHT